MGSENRFWVGKNHYVFIVFGYVCVCATLSIDELKPRKLPFRTDSSHISTRIQRPRRNRVRDKEERKSDRLGGIHT